MVKREWTVDDQMGRARRVLEQLFEIGYQPKRAADGRSSDRVQNGRMAKFSRLADHRRITLVG